MTFEGTGAGWASPLDEWRDVLQEQAFTEYIQAAQRDADEQYAQLAHDDRLSSHERSFHEVREAWEDAGEPDPYDV